MCHLNGGGVRRQLRFLRQQYLQDGQLPFVNCLSEDCIAQALNALGVCWKDRIYSPLMTLWVFLGQILSADHPCRAAVARLIVHRLAHGLEPCSSEPALTAKRESGCPKPSFLKWLVTWDVNWIGNPIPAGFGRDAAYSSTMGRRYRCLTRPRTNLSILNLILRGQD